MTQFMKACSGCGAPIPAGAWCAKCAATDEDAPQRPAVEAHARRENPGGHWSVWRTRQEQDRFRRAVGRRAGWRCQAVGGDEFPDLPPGSRCGAVNGLQAHHDGGAGRMLCGPHHRHVDPSAR